MLNYERERESARERERESERANPTLYILHPTPYTLHPTPYTLRPALYTLQVIAVGDGSHNIPMLKVAGLGVAT